uniref:Uncharacterized protein n=1 Tax=Arundo donax TaxID=35708 RepID=A0A0A8Z1K8_ARUDO
MLADWPFCLHTQVAILD